MADSDKLLSDPLLGSEKHEDDLLGSDNQAYKAFCRRKNLIWGTVCGAIVLAVFLSILLTLDIIDQGDSGDNDSTNFLYWCRGNCDIDVKPAYTMPGACLMGGGVDSDELFQWQIKNTNGGDFLILSAADYEDEYNDYVWDLSNQVGSTPVNSVTTIQVLNRDASFDETVLSNIRKADGIFFEGGDQSRYISWWTGTEVQSLLQGKVHNVTLGGTSAGLAILGNWVFSAEYGSINSYEAMADPYAAAVDIVNAFLHIPFLETILIDTHFQERDRMGRMSTFLARILRDNNLPSASLPIVRVLGVNEPTGIILNITSGDIRLVGEGHAYLCESDHSPNVCEPDTNLTFTKINCTQFDVGDTYNFQTFLRPPLTGADYVNSVVDGNFTDGTTVYGPYP